jgi:hypothetical protein
MLLARICSPLEGKRMKNAGFPAFFEDFHI